MSSAQAGLGMRANFKTTLKYFNAKWYEQNTHVSNADLTATLIINLSLDKSSTASKFYFRREPFDFLHFLDARSVYYAYIVIGRERK